MTKFVFIYHAPQTPADATPPDPEEMQQVMGAWMQWAEKVGPGMVDFGTPLAGGVHVTTDGVAPSTQDVVGYTIIDVENADAALELAKAHPHLNMPGGCSIEVHEAQPVPGM
ncbi:YciI family protein [Microbacterium sp. ASV49]|uniref:YciI family protein n=1 Tax=Microbacterium candidum TaxID=3041922 RepID=A0ABT7N197_9MICO|nr:YciI family protein [Microbacterium sp. ASV49]MDL9980445.1 YciI family protein [Microbacterium sp. ASV49]